MSGNIGFWKVTAADCNTTIARGDPPITVRVTNFGPGNIDIKDGTTAVFDKVRQFETRTITSGNVTVDFDGPSAAGSSAGSFEIV